MKMTNLHQPLLKEALDQPWTRGPDGKIPGKAILKVGLGRFFHTTGDFAYDYKIHPLWGTITRISWHHNTLAYEITTTRYPYEKHVVPATYIL